MDFSKSMLTMGLVLFGIAPLQESRTEASRAAREMMAIWRESAGEERWKAWQAEEAALAPGAAQEPASLRSSRHRTSSSGSRRK